MLRNQEQQSKKRVVPGLRQQVTSASASTNNLGILLAANTPIAAGNPSTGLHISSNSLISTTTLSLVDDDVQLAKINKYNQLGVESHLQALMMTSQSQSTASLTPSVTIAEPQTVGAGGTTGAASNLSNAEDSNADPAIDSKPSNADESRLLATSTGVGTGPGAGAGEQLTVAGVLGESEEQLAEALYRRSQAKLMIDCFNHNTTAFIDGLMPGGHSRRSPEVAMLEAALQDAIRVRIYTYICYYLIYRYI